MEEQSICKARARYDFHNKYNSKSAKCQMNAHRKHGIRPKTFYTWIYRMRQRGEIDIPATIPTSVPKQVKQPEIVKIQVEARPAEVPVDAQSVERPVMSSILPVQSGIPVM